MLIKEKVIKNAKKFHETGVKVGVVNDELMTMLNEEFITAPCSTSSKMYGAYEGGLINHILNVTKYAITINSNLPTEKQLDDNSIIRVSLLHQIGKSDMFIKQDSDWHNKRGEIYKFKEGNLPLKTGELSIFMALKSGINLDKDEVYAILNYSNEFGSSSLSNKGERLASLLKVANLTAIISDK